MSDDDDVANPDVAEGRARELLALVGTRPVQSSQAFALVVARRASRQRAVARPLRLLGQFVSALAAGARGLLEPMRGGRTR